MSNRLLRSAIFRYSVLYLLLFAGSAAGLLGFLYWTTTRYLEQQTEEVIEAEIQGLAEQYRSNGLQGLVGVLRGRSGERGEREAVYLLTDAQLVPLVGNLSQWPVDVTAHDTWADFQRLRIGGDVVPVRAKLFRLAGGFHLLVGREFLALYRTERLIRHALAWSLLGALGLGLIGGWLFTRAVARRIETIDATARRIREGDLAQRIPLSGSGDEFDRLADNLNTMLARIHGLMEGVRHVGNSLAHDMRLPLTRVRNRLEQLKTHYAHTPDAQAEVLSCLAEADQMLATFNALLRIARIEAGGHALPSQTVDLSAVAADATELYTALAEDKRVAVTTELTPATVLGDRDLLFQLLVNLLDNALKWSPDGGCIALHAGVHDGRAEITVSDQGPGVPADERMRVFERFYRVEPSRTAPGSGLGLALVKAVVDLHQGTIELADNAPGLLVRIRLPRNPE